MLEQISFNSNQATISDNGFLFAQSIDSTKLITQVLNNRQSINADNANSESQSKTFDQRQFKN